MSDKPTNDVDKNTPDGEPTGTVLLGSAAPGEPTGTVLLGSAAPDEPTGTVLLGSAAPGSAGGDAGAPDGAAAPASGAPSVTRSAAVMSAATLVSRLTGFVRTWAMAFAIGNTLLTSAYSVANNLPNQIFELLAGGIISSVFLPVYLSQREQHGDEAARSYASSMFSIGLVVLSAVSLLATIFAPQVVFTQTFLSQSLEPEAVRMAVYFFRFFAAQVLFFGIGGLLNSLLNAHREFLWPMLGPVFNNLVVIVTMFGYPLVASQSRDAAHAWLAIGTMLGVVAMFAVQLPAFLRLKLGLRFSLRLRDAALKESLSMALPVTAFVVINLVVASALNAVALRTASNGPATIQYAWLWYQLPYGVIAVSLSTAIFTEMSEAAAGGDTAKLRANVQMGLRTTLFLIIPLAVAILVLSQQLAGLYHAGEFTADDVLVVGQVLAAWCLALPFFAAYRFMYRAFSSLKDLRAFIVIDACGRVVQVFLYFLLTGGMGAWPGLGMVGLPLADAVAHLLLIGAALLLMRQKVGAYGLRAIVTDGCKSAAAALLAAALPAAMAVLGIGGGARGIIWSLASVVGWGCYMLVAYYLLCRLFKLPEIATVDRLASRLLGRLRRRG